MKFDYFKMMSKVEFEMKEDSDIEMDECKHDDYVVCIETNNKICKKCGTVIDFYNQHLIPDLETQTLLSMKGKKSVHCPLKNLKKKLVDYTIRNKHNKIKDEQYEQCLNDLFKAIPTKIIKAVAKKNDVDFEAFYQRLTKQKPVYFTMKQIEEICKIAKEFIQKKTIKYINTKALVYIICRDEFGINMSHYIGSMNENIIEKYDELYKDFKKV